MTPGTRRLGMAMLTAAAALLFSAASEAQDNVCAAQDKRQACSYQCCGRRACPPSCEVDCVKVCVDACNAPAKQEAYGAVKRQLQLRCGNKSPRQ